MNVGIVVYGLDRPLTGISRYTLDLVQALGRPVTELGITLLLAGRAPHLVQDVAWERVCLPGCSRLPGLLTWGNALLSLAAWQRCLDVVHDPTGVSPFLLGAGGAKTVVTVHDVFAWSCPGTSTALDTLIYRHWLPRLARRVDRVITDSRASKADIVRYLGLPPEAIRVIHPGVNAAYRPLPPAQVAAVRARYNIPAGYLLFVGSLEERKNLARLLRAYAQLRGEGERRPLVIAGARKWNAVRTMATLAELQLGGDVILTGYVAEADLPALYVGADLFVFPSLYEGFGLPPLEAMACGTPVVCSNAASLPEVVGDAALTVDPYDVEGLAAAMQRALSDDALRAALRARGLERARRFTWERAAQETLAVYREVLG